MDDDESVALRPPSPDDQRFPSPGTAITVDVLVALSATNSGPMQLRQLSRSLGVPRSTLHRVLQTLKAKGMVQHVNGAGYVIGEGALQLGARYRMKELPQLAAPILQEVQQRTGETVNLAVPHEDAILIVASLQSPEPLRLVSWAGKHDMLHASALGKSYLAALPDDELERTLARITLTPATPKTIVSREALREEVARTRDRGFAIDDEETLEGVRCVGAAIRGDGNQAVAALSVSAPATRLPLEAVGDVGLLVVQAAANISGLLGGVAINGDG